jgi:hypothetical protein
MGNDRCVLHWMRRCEIPCWASLRSAQPMVLSLLHRTPPDEDCPRFVVSEKSGVAQPDPVSGRYWSVALSTA